MSSNLDLQNPEYDARIITCKKSLDSFKSAYGQDTLYSGGRYYFEVKFLHGCNFKIGVTSTTRLKEVAFCDSVEGYAYYSAGQLRNGSKTCGKKYGESFKGTDK